jgi:ABC-type nitrate/sulfonate/bicarbonate transport system permease component
MKFTFNHLKIIVSIPILAFGVFLAYTFAIEGSWTKLIITIVMTCLVVISGMDGLRKIR